MNKEIQRDGEVTTKIFDNRSLEADYTTLIPILKSGMRVLDVGCGTGAISKGIAERVGPNGHVTGIDNTEKFITSGKETYQHIKNLDLSYADIFQFEPEEKFDLIVSARVLQWLNNPVDALKRFKELLKPGGQVSVLDYNHEQLQWHPAPPESMLRFYSTFLRWRADAGMNNHITEDLPEYFAEAGFADIEIHDANEVYVKGQDNFLSKIGIWAKVAASTQMVDEGYISNDDRLQAIDDYNAWIQSEAESMTMVLKEFRGKLA
ncbi:Ubiquinone/menaquinone biosynthesis C-methylase UbiE [Mucilaginibacter mallensis]|uniref:Ubiquinone/menaquinone biosynthesis C-methylase UbiE n=1 Tax=Mucilaginibacter mallensis TaxID=652787 RepID=A0A1H2B6J8_MUCMA|nr:methyltransferase domain-containing protein [Mucilaginibacter mallensis]SDT53811.1 Ubiquinone/menaquinone biosynthesis C-methylase UbiE [Mucilaginibacter mallensis]